MYLGQHMRGTRVEVVINAGVNDERSQRWGIFAKRNIAQYICMKCNMCGTYRLQTKNATRNFWGIPSCPCNKASVTDMLSLFWIFKSMNWMAERPRQQQHESGYVQSIHRCSPLWYSKLVCSPRHRWGESQISMDYLTIQFISTDINSYRLSFWYLHIDQLTS